MTQQSAPQTGHISDGLTPDAGPYSAPRWAGIWDKFLASDPDQGPIGHTGDNTLLVKNPSGTTFTVEAGNALVAGRMLENDAILTFSVAPPATLQRIDVVVAVQNESNVPVTDGIASTNALIFPTVLTDYNSLSSIPPYSARLAILKGTPNASPVAPTLDQNPDLLHMVPLASYEISSIGNITDLTDLRNYAHPFGGGAVYSQEYFANNNQFVYNGRVRLTMVALKFDVGTAATKIVSWQGEPDPCLGCEVYATFALVTIEDFDLKLDYGRSYRVRYATVNATPDYMMFEFIRGGYVDNAGVSQPTPTTSITVYATALIVQYLDVPPIVDGDYV